MEKEKPLVFIILLNYNGTDDTIDCLKSLKKVDYPNMKVIVVDNASTDNSVNRLVDFQKKYSYIFLQSEVNNGFSAGNNIGIKYALDNNADYVLLLNNDTVVEPNFLSIAINESENNEKIGLTIGKILYYKEPNLIWYGGGELRQPYNYPVHLGFKKDKDDPEYNCNKFVTYASGCYFLLKRKTIEDVGLLNEDYFMYCEDTDYSIRVVKNGYCMLYCPKSVIYHKVSSSTGKGSFFSTYYIARNSIILYKKYFTGKKRIIAILFWYYKMFRTSLNGNLNRKAFWSGVRAGKKGELGQAFKDIKDTRNINK